MPGTFFAHFFKDFDYIVRLFQIHQVEKGSFTLRLVRGPQWTEEGETEMLQILSGFIGDTVVTVEHVDEIPLLRTGKRSPVVSDVREDFQGL